MVLEACDTWCWRRAIHGVWRRAIHGVVSIKAGMLQTSQNPPIQPQPGCCKHPKIRRFNRSQDVANIPKSADSTAARMMWLGCDVRLGVRCAVGGGKYKSWDVANIPKSADSTAIDRSVSGDG